MVRITSRSRRHNRAVRRDTSTEPTAAGIASDSVAVDTVVASNSLLLAATNAETASVAVTVPLAGTDTVMTITSSASSATSSSIASVTVINTSLDNPSTATAAANSDLSKLSNGAIVGICLGALAASGLILGIVVLILRKWVAPTDEHAKNDERKTEPWAKLGDDDDRWDGMGHAPPQNQLFPNGAPGGGRGGAKDLEKSATVKSQTSDYEAGFFNKSPSVRSGENSEEKASATHESAFDTTTMPNFAKYTPNLAQQFAEDPSAEVDVAAQRPFQGRIDGAPVVSWDHDSVGDDSFLSMRSVRMSETPMSSSPSFGAMRQMSEVTVSSPLHQWQRAEVVTSIETTEHNPFEDQVVVQSPVEEEDKTRRSAANPFFGATDPFADSNRTQAGHPARRSSVKTNGRMDSVFSDMSTVMGSAPDGQQRTMQSLIAALDAPQANHQNGNGDERLSVGLAPSVISEMYTAEEGEGEGRITSQFPMPPSPQVA